GEDAENSRRRQVADERVPGDVEVIVPGGEPMPHRAAVEGEAQGEQPELGTPDRPPQRAGETVGREAGGGRTQVEAHALISVRPRSAIDANRLRRGDNPRPGAGRLGKPAGGCRSSQYCSS